MAVPRSMPALITPFTPDGEIDGDAFAGNLAALWERGVRGFLVAGSTGEGPYLEPGERRRLVARARRTVPNAHLVCGIAAESLRAARSQCAEAAEGGADAVLVITPTTLVRGRDDLVASYYEQLAEISRLPVLLYTVPKVTGYGLPVEAIGPLSAHPAIVGIKDSSGDVARIGPTRQAAGDSFMVFCGSTPALAAAVEAGADGAITASSNYAFSLVDATVAAAVSGTTGMTAETLATVAGEIERHGIPGVKAAAGMVGLRPGSCRLPLPDPMPEVIAAIRGALRSANLI